MLKANPQGDGIGDVAFRRGLGHDSGALMNGVSAQHFRDNFHFLIIFIYLFIGCTRSLLLCGQLVGTTL